MSFRRVMKQQFEESNNESWLIRKRRSVIRNRRVDLKGRSFIKWIKGWEERLTAGTNNNQYAAWNRTRRLHAPTFLARTDSQAARAARATTANNPTNRDTIINMGDLLPSNGTERVQKKKQETLFGPSIGVITPGPSWAQESSDIKESSIKVQDTLTPELVKSWAERSKEGSQPTTTLQALVNLKRPSLRLSPISHDEPEESEPSQPVHHGLEFQFDCDAPKCRISLYVVPLTLGKDASSSSTTKPVVLFNTVVEGGFGRLLKLEEGAMLELDKYDIASQSSNGLTLQVPAPSTGTASASSPTSPSAPEQPSSTDNVTHHHKKRFHLRIRKRTHPHAAEDTTRLSVAGPALQVVDMEAPTENVQKGKDEEGVRVFIKLEALDVDEYRLASPNSQTTYLHIVRLGSAPESGSPDTRPWVVRVVKREATIGPHTFHLHEIYGLGSQSSNTHSHGNDTTHSYPPTAAADNDDPTSECLVCLSSPREVVLLPCRHLVACKECAVNMVEFGAGGQLVHTEDAADAPPTGNAAAGAATGEPSGEGSAAANGEENGGTPAAGTATTTPQATQPRPRRKRKAKGWFCPVCRQPYTSLLKISTAAAPACALNKAKDLDHEDRASSPDSVDSHHTFSPLSVEAVPIAAAMTSIAENENTHTEEEVVEPTPPQDDDSTAAAAPDSQLNDTTDTSERQTEGSVQEETFHDAEDQPLHDITPGLALAM
ncbi:hypothetical protein Clacol_009338 [Clathrus columnatus]|uniref:RING-type domain-containing protein n=1 Tax=Clathrus columnatus TaxID=1419009 RepID=A0AAV5ANJ4_9AGAM|nr:hypothetical protein Clacol_009338 [Clathrus columnatus]